MQSLTYLVWLPCVRQQPCPRPPLQVPSRSCSCAPRCLPSSGSCLACWCRCCSHCAGRALRWQRRLLAILSAAAYGVRCLAVWREGLRRATLCCSGLRLEKAWCASDCCNTTLWLPVGALPRPLLACDESNV
jgi:hypothetical protein